MAPVVVRCDLQGFFIREARVFPSDSLHPFSLENFHGFHYSAGRFVPVARGFFFLFFAFN